MGTRLRGIFSFLGKRISPFDPQEKGIRLAVSGSNGLYASGMEMPARGKAALALRYDLPLLLLSATALPVLRWYSLITVYRGTPQCGERSNATFRRQSAAKQTSLAPHDSKARLRVVTTRRDSWRSHVHRTYIAQRVQLFKPQTANANAFLLDGHTARFLFTERKWGV